MADYINRELLLKDLETSIVVSGRNDVAPLELRGVHKVINRIKAIPTEDVVPVVRCKDCGMSRETEDERYLFCMNFADTVSSQAFCSYGERKCDDE